MSAAKQLVEQVRFGLTAVGLGELVRVHYGGQARGRAHRLWLRGNVLGLEREICMTIGAEPARDPHHITRFVGQALNEAAGMVLANRFRP